MSFRLSNGCEPPGEVWTSVRPISATASSPSCSVCLYVLCMCVCLSYKRQEKRKKKKKEGIKKGEKDHFFHDHIQKPRQGPLIKSDDDYN